MTLEEVLSDKKRQWWYCNIADHTGLFNEKSIGFDCHPLNNKNLTQYDSVEQLQNDCGNLDITLSLWNFYQNAMEGDIVFIGQGKGSVNAPIKKISKIAIITGDYFYTEAEYHYRRNVEYLEKIDLEIDLIRPLNVYFLEIDDKNKESLCNMLVDKKLLPTRKKQESSPLNQILYGSPGTGKTYSTIEKALEILGINTDSKGRQEQKELFEEYRENGQIEFVTFHQNYGYEEFVEGIKPKIDKNNNVKYEIKKGIFQVICDIASSISFSSENISCQNNTFNNSSTVWKISLGEQGEEARELQSYCFKNDEIRIGWNDVAPDTEKSLRNFYSMDIGDIVCVFKNTTSINAVGIIQSEVKEDERNKNNTTKHFKRYRKVKWLIKNQEIDFLKLNKNVQLARQTAYCLRRVQSHELLHTIQEKMQKENDSKLSILEDNTKKPHILIIDEINRGNVSKIFGELITLIEPSKRIGAEEELRVTLPYSQKPFGVPSNLYIIGTMNTADRSITSLDTAIRRRFEFVEMMPDPTKLKDKGFEGIELDKLLQAINERIEFLYDREKTIGHAYLLDIKNLNDLKEVFQNKIIPLLQEYFYNDYEAINAVLNNNGMIEVKVDSNKQEKSEYIFKGAFKDFVNDRGLDEKKIFKIASKDKKDIWDAPNTYKKIYVDGNNDEANLSTSIER